MVDEASVLRELQSAVHALGELVREEDIVQVLLSRAQGALDARGAVLRLLGPDGDRLELKGALGLSDRWLGKGPVCVSQREVDRRVLAGETVLSADLCAEPDYPYASQAAAEGLHAALVVPLSLRQRVIGVLRVFVDHADAVSAGQVAWCQVLADLGALAIEKARLHDSLMRLSEALNSSLELAPMLHSVLATTVAEMGFTAASVRLLDADGGTLRLVAAVGLSETYRAKGEVTVAGSPVDQRALAGETVVIRDVASEPGWQYPEALVREGICAALVVPLTLEGRSTGVLRAYSACPRPFGPVAQSYLTAVARLVALAIEKAELHGALQNRYADLKLDLAEWYRFLALG